MDVLEDLYNTITNAPMTKNQQSALKRECEKRKIHLSKYPRTVKLFKQFVLSGNYRLSYLTITCIPEIRHEHSVCFHSKSLKILAVEFAKELQNAYKALYRNNYDLFKRKIQKLQKLINTKTHSPLITPILEDIICNLKLINGDEHESFRTII